MTTYIEKIITEVVVNTETSTNAEPLDERWSEKHKVEALTKQQNTRAERISAEGLDD